MSSVNALPPYNKIFLVGIWMESTIWGMNCVVFSGALRVLINRKPTPWMLIITSIILFIVAIIHIAGSLSQLLEAFIYIPSNAPANYSTLYWAEKSNSLNIMNTALYDTAVGLQDLVLIWRLYVVWGYSWKMCIFPVVLEIVHSCTAYTSTVLWAAPNANIYDENLASLGLVAWAFELILNISVTTSVAGRLWYMGTRVSSILPTEIKYNLKRPHKYLASILVLVESGALFSAATVVMLGLYVTHSPLALVGLNISTQLATLTPLLIIVRVGLNPSHPKRETEGLGLTPNLNRPTSMSWHLSAISLHITNSNDASRSPKPRSPLQV